MSCSEQSLSPKDFSSVSDESDEGCQSPKKFSFKNISNLKIYVGNINPFITSKQLYEYFRPYGPIIDAIVIPNDDRTKNRGFGFVTFKFEDSALEAIEYPPYINGYLCKVNYASENQKPKRSNFKPKHGKGYGIEYYNQDSDLFRTKNIQLIEAAKIMPTFDDECKLNKFEKENIWDLTILFAGTSNDNDYSTYLWDNIMNTYLHTFQEIENNNINSDQQILYSTFLTRPLNLSLLTHLTKQQ